jgi:N-methylhydantoinase A
VRSRDTGDARVGGRPVYFCGEMRESEVYDRELLPEGATVRGPAILQEPGATTALPPRATARVVEGGHLVMEVG